MTTTNFQHRPRRNWLQINITCKPKDSEHLIYELTSLTGVGVQTESIADQELIICYLEKDKNYLEKRKILDKLIASFSQTTHPPTVELSTLVEENWAENWKSNYKPTKLSEHITVKPTWEDYEAQTAEIVLEIDPGMAFGTGLHFSTRLALHHIDTLFQQTPSPETVIDVGTGTGILALACAKLGASKITAIDNDPDAIVTAIDNIQQNREQETIDCSTTDLTALDYQADLVIANITADVLTLLQPALTTKIKPKGHLILAGILTGKQADDIINLFTNQGLQLKRDAQDEEWTSLLFEYTP